MQTIIFTCPSPSKKFLKRCVNFESRYGTFFDTPVMLFSRRISKQLRSVISELFMFPASRNLWPVFLVRFVRSLPAKSTSESCDTVIFSRSWTIYSPSWSTGAWTSRIEKTLWLRLDSALRIVWPIRLRFCPVWKAWSASSTDFTSSSVMPCTNMLWLESSRTIFVWSALWKKFCGNFINFLVKVSKL